MEQDAEQGAGQRDAGARVPAWAWAGAGALLAGPAAYAAETWLPARAAYAALGVVLAGALWLGWSGRG